MDVISLDEAIGKMVNQHRNLSPIGHMMNSDDGSKSTLLLARVAFGKGSKAASNHAKAGVTSAVDAVDGSSTGASARACLAALGSQLRALKAQILEFDRRIISWHRSSATSKRLDAIPGVGPALVASVADVKAFRSGRDFSAWVGLVPKQNSSGGKNKLGSISKQGDRCLRSLFTAGALAVIRYAKIHSTGHRSWLTALLARRPTKVAAIALADKLARMAWAMMARNEPYKEPTALAV